MEPSPDHDYKDGRNVEFIIPINPIAQSQPLAKDRYFFEFYL